MFAVFLTVLVGPLEVVGPYLFGCGVDKYIVPGSESHAPCRGGAARRLPGLPRISWPRCSLSFAVQYLQVRIMQNVGQQTLYDLRNDIFERLQRLPMSFYDRSPVGRLVTRVTTDVDALNDLFAAGIAAMANDAIVLLCIGAVMMKMNWRLALATFAVLPLIHDFHLDFPRPRARRQPPHSHGHRANQFVPAGTHQRHEHRADLQPREKIAGAIRGAESHPHGSLQGRDHRFRRLFPCGRTVQHRGHRHRLLVWRLAFADAVLVDVGVLITFMQYAQRFFRPIQDLSEKFNILQSAMAACERIFKLLDEPVPAPPAETPLALTGAARRNRIPQRVVRLHGRRQSQGR